LSHGIGSNIYFRRHVLTINFLFPKDADSMAHAIYEPGSPAVQQISELWGPEVLVSSNDSSQPPSIDRKRLGAKVFADPAAMRQLEQIVWPHVQVAIQERIRTLKEEYTSNGGDTATQLPIVVVEAAVLLDAGWHSFLDGVWVITASRDVAVQRLMTLRGMSETDALQRIDAQQSRRGMSNLQDEVQKGMVSAVITNNDNDANELREALQSKLHDPSAWYAQCQSAIS
jgi:dephospho-CoA kinase